MGHLCPLMTTGSWRWIRSLLLGVRRVDCWIGSLYTGMASLRTKCSGASTATLHGTNAAPSQTAMPVLRSGKLPHRPPVKSQSAPTHVGEESYSWPPAIPWIAARCCRAWPNTRPISRCFHTASVGCCPPSKAIGTKTYLYIWTRGAEWFSFRRE